MSKYIRMAISAVLLSVIAWRTNWSDVAGKFSNLRFEMWFAAVGLLVVAQVASARRWQLFARELRFERSLPAYCAYYFIGMYFNLLLPTSVGGDVMRVVYLNGKSGRKAAAFASVLLERVNGLLVLIAIACVGVLITPVPLPWWIGASVWGIAGCAVLGTASLPLAQRLQILPPVRRQQIRTMWHLSKIPSVLAGATFMSVIVQVLGVLTLWFIGLGLGMDIPIAYYCILGPMVSLLTLLPLSVNGMGVRETACVVFLAPLQVEEGTALSLAFLWFACSAAVSLGGGLVYLFGSFTGTETPANLNNEGTNDHGSVDRDSDQGREGQHQKAA